MGYDYDGWFLCICITVYVAHVNAMFLFFSFLCSYMIPFYWKLVSILIVIYGIWLFKKERNPCF